MSYAVWVAVGIAMAALAARWQGEQVSLPSVQRTGLLVCAIGGAILGAYGLQLPADLLGWAAPAPAGLGPDALPLGGRTVLGGLIGGWLAVELGKRRLGIAVATGDGFALPLSLALGFGRLGCASAGCCGGVACGDAWWALRDASGMPHVPVQLLESGFHFGCAAWLALAARKRWGKGLRLAIYLALYACVRFALEFARTNPPVVLGLSWHQLLALLLLAIAGGTCWQRARRCQ
jgi:phosphatidylglycerol:prolipoprotein diacylglycerol transferase